MRLLHRIKLKSKCYYFKTNTNRIFEYSTEERQYDDTFHCQNYINLWVQSINYSCQIIPNILVTLNGNTYKVSKGIYYMIKTQTELEYWW